ncbi:hypothetical protein [Marispirochaeta sp.]|uniref:hypothetical protein n=1 Tax=Marispirochaeta sp. TaxID=2038653 RepID=UPI0029C77AAD|nr:hypothetical protein [Marispirochaeta sp.]
MNEGCFYPAECTVFPAAGGEVLLKNRNSGSSLFLPAAQYELFAFLHGCVSLEEHLQTMLQANRYGVSPETLRKLLQGWVASGLLRPETLLKAGAGKKGRALPGTEDRSALTAAVITADRPEALKQWVESRTGHPDFSVPGIPIFIFDGSRDPGNVKVNRRTAVAASEDYSGSLVYFGETEKRPFRDSLIDACRQKDIPEYLVDFALYGPESGDGFIRTGANRNTAQLVSGMGNTIYSDDDLYYTKFAHPGSVLQGLRFEAGGYSRLKFFASPEDLHNYAVPLEDYNLIAKIEEQLGGSPEINGGEGADVSAVTPGMARSLEEGGSFIGAVSTGYCGARWFTDRYFVDAQRVFSDDSLYLDRLRYTAAAETGLNIHAVSVPTINDGLIQQGGSLALDGSRELPAYFPLDRQEDSCFGMLFLACNPGARTLHLPAALYHDPSVKTAVLSGAGRSLLPGPGQMNHIILSRIAGHFISESPGRRLSEAAQKYTMAASLRPGSFLEYLRSCYSEYARGRLAFIDRLLDIYNAEPQWWASSLRDYREALTSVLSDPLVNLPPDYRTWLYMYGELLEAWPVLRTMSAEIVNRII